MTSSAFRLKNLWFFILFLAPLLGWCEDPLQAPTKKKILVLCSNGGHGHNAASTTLQSLLKDNYEFKIVYPIDQLRIWGVKSGEQAYNWALQSGHTRSVNMVTRHLAPKLFRTRKKMVESIVHRHIEKEKPDLVLSLIPFINCPASEAARKLDIPFLLVTTDNDLRNWVHGLQGISHPRFKVTVGSDLWCSREMLRKRNIPDSAIATIGLPIRPDFFVQKDVKALRAQYHIPQHKPVVLVIIGGAGGSTALQYAKTIGSTQLGIHLIVCAGKNKALAHDLQKIQLHPTNTMSVMGFTDKMSDLMALADLLITKPGPGTLTEAMIMHLPVLIDSTSPVLSWERANIDLIMHYGVGDFIEDFDEVEPLLRHFLYDAELRQALKNSYKKIPSNCFAQSIEGIIQELCHPSNPLEMH